MVENEAGSPTTNIGVSAGVIGFFAATPVAQQTITAASALSVENALVNLGLCKK